MKIKFKNIHMIGIGGSGMSGIAEVLLNLGYRVSGSDMAESQTVERLRELGARIAVGHAAANVESAEVVVRSTAIAEDNPELVEANSRSIPVIPRAEMLAELMRLRTGIAVAGTHGKTTTTSLLAAVFGQAGLDPTVIIGGRLNAFGSNALLGRGEYLIAEADESDGSFLCLSPIMSVVTNVDADHLDYYSDIDDIRDTFVTFMNKTPFYGVNVVCGDDPGVRSILPRIKRPVVTYGLGPENELRGVILESGKTSRFEVWRKDQLWGEVTLSRPGRHNVLNALGAIGLAMEADLPREAITLGLLGFSGVARRFEFKGERNGVIVVDDYGHHPTEIAATLSTARSCYPDRRLVVVFQPHRFTRTQALFGDFCKAFGNVDELLLTEIYPASEAPIPGVSGQALAQGVRQISRTPTRFYQGFEEISEALPGILKSGDLLLTLGAGSVWKVGQKFLHG